MRILITAGPTREYLDDVRYLSNASSGRMGFALAEAILAAGIKLFWRAACLVDTTCWLRSPSSGNDRRSAVGLQSPVPRLRRVIATAAVCDYRPKSRFPGKLAKTGVSLELELVETADVLADLGRHKGARWIIGFALESDEYAHVNALKKLKHKNCDAIVLNRPTAIGAETNQIEVIDDAGSTVVSFAGTKLEVATQLWAWIEQSIVSRAGS